MCCLLLMQNALTAFLMEVNIDMSLSEVNSSNFMFGFSKFLHDSS